MQSQRPQGTGSLGSPDSKNLLDRRLLVIVGKGGVGRTAVSCAMALLAARSGKRVLLCQTKSKDRLGTLFGVPKSFAEIQPVTTNLWAVNMTPEAALREYGIMVLRSSFIYKQVFERDIVKAFLRAVPGLLDYAMLGKAWYHTTEMAGGRPKYDLVVLDAPATGHSVTLLSIPQVIVSTVPEGPLTGPARACQELLTDPSRCRMLPVTLAEDLPVTEAVQLDGQLRRRGFPMGPVVVNRLYPPRFGSGVSQLALSELTSAERAGQVPPSLGPLLSAARLLSQRAALNEHHLERLERELPLRQVHLPYLFTPEFGKDAIEELARRLEGQIDEP